MITSGGSIQDQFSLPPVGAILQENWQNWEQLKASSWVVSILKHGYKLSFQSNPPLQRIPVFFKPPESQQRRQLLELEIKSLANKRAIELVQPGKPAFYSRMFLVPKSEDRWRPIIDLSILNKYLRTPSFHMETPESIRLAIQPQDWTISIDLSDAYLHIPIHRDHRKYLTFAHQNQIWQFRALAFGLSPAPWIFTRVVEEVKKMAQNRSLIMHQYLDDWLVRSQSRELLVEQTQWLLGLCEYLGLQVNLAKSELHPTKDFEYVGYRHKTGIHKVFPTEKRIRDIQEKGKQFLKMNPNTAQDWMSMLGLLTSAEKVVPMGRLHLRELQYCLKSQWSQAHETTQKLVPLTEMARLSLNWWVSKANLRRGSPTHPPKPQYQVFTDASILGWGAHMDMKTISGKWTPKTGRNAHRQSRIVSSPPSLTTLGIKPGKQYCANCHRQLHCCCICKQAGRNNYGQTKGT